MCKEEKCRQTIYERAEIGERTITEIRKLLKNVGAPIEVIGHMEIPALCCGNGTVAIVRVNLDEVM